MPAFASPAAAPRATTQTAFVPRLSPQRRHAHVRTPQRHRPSVRAEKADPFPFPDPGANTASPPRQPFSASSSALQEGIRAVAVGKLGAKPVPAHLFPALYDELSLASQSPATAEHFDLHILRASFLGALFVKAALSADERALLSWAVLGERRDGVCAAEEVVAAVDAGGAGRGGALGRFAVRVLRGETLSRGEAEELGGLLYSVETRAVGTWPVRVLIAHVMRVRHETTEELCGLAVAAQGSVRAGWFDGVREGKGAGEGGGRFALVAEPFDGVVSADLMTGVVCARLQKYGLRAVMGVGESGGPKYGPNARAVGRAAGVRFCRSAAEVAAASAEAAGAVLGVAVDQADVSPGLAGWGRVRRCIVKRPSVATTEKFVDGCPGGAALFVASAFHDGYVDKMAAAAEAVGFEGYVIVGRGVEGTVGLGVAARRTARLAVGWRRAAGGGGGYGREEVRWNAVRDGQGRVGVGLAERRGEAQVEAMARRWVRWAGGQACGETFEARAAATEMALDRAMEVLRRERGGVFGARRGRSI